jgi:pyridoxine kinase
LAVSSHVVHGQVGLPATVPALQWLGHDVWALPTVLFASRPGLGLMSRHPVPARDLAAMLDALEADGGWPSVDAVLVGYFPGRETITAVADAIARIKTANPAAVILVDPILGDDGRLYVDADTATAIRDLLLPLATVATPNLTELRWLAGGQPDGPDEIAAAARRIGSPLTVVTSAMRTADSSVTLLVTETGCVTANSTWRRQIPNGAGDLFAGLFLGHMLAGRTSVDALHACIAVLDRILAASEGQATLQLTAL